MVKKATSEYELALPASLRESLAPTTEQERVTETNNMFEKQTLAVVK